jgi:hypothetical protein
MPPKLTEKLKSFADVFPHEKKLAKVTPIIIATIKIINPIFFIDSSKKEKLCRKGKRNYVLKSSQKFLFFLISPALPFGQRRFS